jgi:hypothetical protein
MTAPTTVYNAVNIAGMPINTGSLVYPQRTWIAALDTREPSFTAGGNK